MSFVARSAAWRSASVVSGRARLTLLPAAAATRSFSAVAPAPMGQLGQFLKGKKALVTGSTSGIGLGIARVLAAHGADLTLNGLSAASEVAHLENSIREEFGVKVNYHIADLSKPEEITGMMDSCQGVDILINNAGIQYVSPISSFPEDMWEKVIAINLNAVFHTTKAAIPAMKEKGWGRIINISSVHGIVASINKAPYVASKHGVVGFTKVAALELAGSGVTSNSVNPGWVLTPLVQKQIDLRAEQMGISLDEARVSLLAEKQPSKEFVTVEDLGNFVTFLCSPYSSQITGASFVMDGAWTAQ